ncbi:MAG: nucleotidyltransferase family protein [Aestuariivirga sp.]
MTEAIGSHAMILAAGFGLRMRPLTNDRPKPLIEVAGKPLIDYGFDRLRESGVQKVVVNGHYKAEQILQWSWQQAAPEVLFSDEQTEILDTGGGIAKALPLLGPQPFFVINSDSFWTDGRVPALSRLRAAWDDTTMDCLLLLCHVDRTIGYDGRGDFRLERDGRLTRQQGSGALAYIGAYLVHPRLFAGVAVEKFSMNVLWDKAISEGRMHGMAHSGKWFHVGTPDAIGLAEAELAKT